MFKLKKKKKKKKKKKMKKGHVDLDKLNMFSVYT